MAHKDLRAAELRQIRQKHVGAPRLCAVHYYYIPPSRRQKAPVASRVTANPGHGVTANTKSMHKNALGRLLAGRARFRRRCHVDFVSHSCQPFSNVGDDHSNACGIRWISVRRLEDSHARLQPLGHRNGMNLRGTHVNEKGRRSTSETG